MLWPDIDSIHRATHKPSTPERPAPVPLPLPSPVAPTLDLSFAGIARQRRSALDFDGATRITAASFFAIFECLLPRRDTAPWNALPSAVLVHPALMVHRVDGLEAGLYMFLRDAAALADLKRSMRPEWLWQKIGPDHPRPRPPACAPPGSAVSSMRKCTRYLESAIGAGKACTVGGDVEIPGSPPCRRMSSSLEAARLVGDEGHETIDVRRRTGAASLRRG
ncbi:MAG: hypothetical protein ABI537_15240 [Casimicrobiaceae bacterium]